MSGSITEEVDRIEAMDLETLRAEWARRYGATPSLRSVAILRMMLAWRLQAQAKAGLDPDTRRALSRKGKIKAEGLDLGIGARLTRN